MADLLRYVGRILRAGDVGQDDDELVTALAHHRIPAANALPEPPGYSLQQPVASMMAQRIVDCLEAVQVDEQEGDSVALAPGLGQRKGCKVHHQDAIGQSGERIMSGEMLELGRGFVLGKVAFGARNRIDFAALVSQGRSGQPDFANGSIFADTLGLARVEEQALSQPFQHGELLDTHRLGYELRYVHLQRFRLAVAVHPLGASIPGRNLPVNTVDQDGVV